LAGFTDADGNFSITVYNRKKNSKLVRTNVQTFFRIEVKTILEKLLQIKVGLVILVL
jgi:hypothetical protein